MDGREVAIPWISTCSALPLLRAVAPVTAAAVCTGAAAHLANPAAAAAADAAAVAAAASAAALASLFFSSDVSLVAVLSWLSVWNQSRGR